MKKFVLRLIGLLLLAIPYAMAVLYMIEKGWIINALGAIGAIFLLAALILGAARLLTLKNL